MPKLCFCQCTYEERKIQTLECVERMLPFADRVIIISGEDRWEELDPKVEYYQIPWRDNFPEYRNEYVARVSEGDWIAYSDPDELYCFDLAHDLHSITAEAEARGENHLFVNSHDETLDSDGQTRTVVSNYFKGLLFRKGPGSHYEGVGQAKNVHEFLYVYNDKTFQLDPKYFYTHKKKYWEIWERAARNIFIGGGGDNVGTDNPSWGSLRQICTELGLDNWPLARRYFRRGNIDPRLLQWLRDNRVDGTNYEHEEFEFGRWYFEYLHPEEEKA